MISDKRDPYHLYGRVACYLAVCIMCVISIASAGCIQTSPAAVTTGSPTASTAGTNPIIVLDSAGKETVLQQAAERIVATNSDCAEMLIAIGAADKIVGVSDTVYNNKMLMSQLSPGVVNIGNWQTPNVEAMMNLKPDVVICYSYASSPKNIDQIIAANLTIVSLDCYKMSTLVADASTLGNITGNIAGADKYAQFLQGYLKLAKGITANLTDAEKPTIYWESYTDYSSVGKGAGGDDMIKAAGGTNVAGNNTTTYPKVNAEWIVASNPSYIIKILSPTNNTTVDDFKKLRDTMSARPGMDRVDAVKNGHVYVMSNSISYGARGIVGLLYIAKLMHPDLYANVDPNAVLKEYAQEFLPGSDQGTFIYPTT